VRFVLLARPVAQAKLLPELLKQRKARAMQVNDRHLHLHRDRLRRLDIRRERRGHLSIHIHPPRHRRDEHRLPAALAHLADEGLQILAVARRGIGVAFRILLLVIVPELDQHPLWLLLEHAIPQTEITKTLRARAAACVIHHRGLRHEFPEHLPPTREIWPVLRRIRHTRHRRIAREDDFEWFSVKRGDEKGREKEMAHGGETLTHGLRVHEFEAPRRGTCQAHLSPS
jgi:hypothetical protein